MFGLHKPGRAHEGAASGSTESAVDVYSQGSGGDVRDVLGSDEGDKVVEDTEAGAGDIFFVRSGPEDL